ncbi:MAG: alpha/beta hydrolase [Actinomycetota bacterium]|nr:alpha/beta hydrolase [Actinomycetota bacterium]
MTDGLLLVHAFPLDASMWEPQVSALRVSVSMVVPNLPGFGGTPPAGDVMTMAAAARRAVEALDEAGLDRAVVCGLSMGGYVALELWRSARDRVAGFVFANTRAGADDEAGAERRRALAERLRSEGNGFLVEQPPPLLSASAPDELWDRVKGIIAAQPADAIAAASLGMAERPDSTPDLAGIDVPTLVVTSTGDTLIPADATTPMADAVPDARLEVIEGAGHLSNLEAPEEFTRLLEEHLRRCGLA